LHVINGAEPRIKLVDGGPISAFHAARFFSRSRGLHTLGEKLLGFFQSFLSRRSQVLARPVDLERQHAHS
jgi:hypothetical protein